MFCVGMPEDITPPKLEGRKEIGIAYNKGLTC